MSRTCAAVAAHRGRVVCVCVWSGERVRPTISSGMPKASTHAECQHTCLPACGGVCWPVAGEGHKAAKLKVKEERVAGVAKVVGISKLK